jgi:hypothetical protein
MKTTIEFSIGELFCCRGHLRHDRIFNARRLVRKSDVIIARDTMTGADVILWGSGVFASDRPRYTLVIECDCIHALEETDAARQHVVVELGVLRQAIEEVKGAPCEFVRLE